MSFAPVRLELGINYGTLVTYRFNTAIAVIGDGSEQRNAGWSQPLARYQIGQRDVDGPTLDYLLSFFEARKGSYEAFLFRDWADYEYSGGTSKTYTAGGSSVTRPITHPASATTFDVPVRFEQDEINFRFKAYRQGDGAKIFELENLSLTEVRMPYTLPLDPLPTSLGLLDLGYDYETIGGPTFSTSTLGNNAGWENRRANWLASKGKWNIGDRTLTKAELATLISWFRVARGAAVPWTFFDWQTEAEVDVRFGTDEISFRFDAYQASDGQSIWSLSGLQAIAVLTAPEPPPPPDCTPASYVFESSTIQEFTLDSIEDVDQGEGGSPNKDATLELLSSGGNPGAHGIVRIYFGGNFGAGTIAYWKSSFSYTPLEATEIITFNYSEDVKYFPGSYLHVGQSIYFVVWQGSDRYSDFIAGFAGSNATDTNWTQKAKNNISLSSMGVTPIPGIPLQFGFARLNGHTLSESTEEYSSVGIDNWSLTVNIGCP